MSTTRAPRNGLNRERIIEVALQLVDLNSIDGLTMRALAAELGVKPMALYNHFDNKDELLDALVDRVFAELGVPEVGGDWRVEVKKRCLQLREVLRTHGWAVTLLDSRSQPGPATLTHHDAMLGVLFASGLTWAQVGTAVAMLDSFVYGFVIQELALPVGDPDDFGHLAEGLLAEIPAGEFVSLSAFAASQVLVPGYDFAAEFERGLDLLLAAISAQLG